MRRLALGMLALTACCHRAPAELESHGTIEVTEIDVAARQPARVVRVTVEEGALVQVGDTVALLTQAELPANLSAQQARLAAAEANLRDLENGARAPEIGRAQAELEAAEAEATRATQDLARVRPLAERDVVSRQQLDQAVATQNATTARRDAAASTLRLLKEGTRPERIRAARSDVASARAAIGAVEATASDLILTAPIAGTVLARYAEPGEVLAAGIAALSIGETARPWVRVYLAGRDVARVKVGDAARITLDGVPDASFAGKVTAINPRAEFTPRAALSEEERADLMFGLKIEVTDTTGTLKPGLSATVRLTRAARPKAAS